MVDNIHEIEPVVKKDSPAEREEDDAEDEEPQHPDIHIDPAQMKLEL
jgi:hypothetical protein